MFQRKFFRTYFVPLVLIIVSFVPIFGKCGGENSSEVDHLHRQKRFLLYYPNGGTFKLVIGFAIPVKLGLKQSMAVGWNLQFQYAAAQSTNNTQTYPPIIDARGRRDKRNSNSVPNERALAYLGVEAILDKNGITGRACVLRAICENSAESLHQPANELYGRLMHIALTPDYDEEDDLDREYLDARRAGEFGVDCVTLYPDCRPGTGLLDMISLLDY